MRTCISPAIAPPPSLVQIQRRYATACQNLRLSVQTDPEGWKAQIRDPQDNRTLYSAYRCSLSAAKIAAAEFVVFRAAGAMGRISPEAVAQGLEWSEFWRPEDAGSPRII